MLEEQVYRLSYWRTASHEINYRRFFDINSLAGLRVEDADVFAAIHQLLERLIRERRVTGVRIDHPDGLFDPARYFEWLQNLAADAWAIPHGGRPLYVVVEKSCPAGNSCRRAGRSTERPATTSSIRSTGCSWTPGMRGVCGRSTTD